MKRILIGMLAWVLLASNPCYIWSSYAAAINTENILSSSGTEQSRPQTLIAENSLGSPDTEQSRQKRTAIGKILSSSIAGDNRQEEPDTTNEGRAGCNIFSIYIKGRKAEASFETDVDAILIIAFYNEEGTQMLEFSRERVSAQQKEAVIEIKEGRDIPNYFYLRGVLLETDTMRPLCRTYESPIYTKGMKEIPAPVLLPDAISYSLEHMSITGRLNLEISPSVKIYESSSYQYAEIVMDYTAKLTGLKLSEAGEAVFLLPQMASLPTGAVISFTASANNPAEIDVVLSGKIGYSLQNGIKIRSLASVPSVKAVMAQEGNVCIGLNIDFTDMELGDAEKISVSMNAAIGGKIYGQLISKEDSVSVKHERDHCIHGEVISKADLEYQVKMQNTGIHDTYQNSFEKQTGLFYCSSDGGNSDSQSCPDLRYRASFMVMDADGKQVEQAQLQVNSVAGTEAVNLITDKHGRAAEYLSDGDYEVRVITLSGMSRTIKMTMHNQAKNTVIRMTPSVVEGILADEIVTSSAVKFKSIVLGDTHSGAIDREGNLYTWGWNRYGQLGNGTLNEQLVPAQIQLKHVKSADFGMECSGAVTEDGSLYTWGWNEHGQLGYDTDQNYNPLPQKVNLPGRVISVSMGTTHSGAVTEDGSLYTWGNNSDFQLGYETKSEMYNAVPKKVELSDPVIDFSCGDKYSGAVTEDGSLYTWGSNEKGQLGRSTVEICEYTPKKVTIPEGFRVLNLDFGYEHGGVITENGLYMWGSDFFNQGAVEACPYPIKVDIPNSVSVCMHPAGMNSGVLTDDGFLYTWGFNIYGELGDGSDEEERFVPAKINVLHNIVSASIGSDTGGAVTEDGSVYIWGLNFFGGLGNGEANTFDRNSDPQKLFSAGNDTAVFYHLTPNETYNFYMVKDRTNDDLLADDNLIYMSQGVADSSGMLKMSYTTLDDYSGVELFVKGADKKDLSKAQITVLDMEYDGTIQYVQPKVLYNGLILTEGKDYELAGGYCGKDIGSYAAVIHGIGEYKGMQRFSYQITPGTKLVENITLSLEDASIEAGSTLQLSAQVYPKDAANPTLKWSSDNTDIAEIDQNGLVTGIREGQVLITASSQDGSGLTAGCMITVTVRPSGDNTDSGPDTSTGSTGDSSQGSSQDENSSTGSSQNGYPSQGDTSGDMHLHVLYYIVYFEPNGGNNLTRSEMTLLMDDTLGIMPKVQRKKYAFAGWHTQKTKGRKVEEHTVLNASTTLYAQWEKIEKPGKVKNISLKHKGGRKVLVKFQEVGSAEGYEITFSTNRIFTAKSSRKKLVSAGADYAEALITLKKNRTCYVRVRAYREDSAGNRIYGSYSDTQKIKIG